MWNSELPSLGLKELGEVGVILQQDKFSQSDLLKIMWTYMAEL